LAASLASGANTTRCRGASWTMIRASAGFRVDIAGETLDGAPKYQRDGSWSDWDAVDLHYSRGA
jgi:hypothetical protein